MLRVFIGFDSRQPIAFNVAQSSVARRCSVPVSITPLMLETLPVKRTGLTSFTYSRFLVPHLCNYEGRAVFLDSDMLAQGDIAELVSLADKDASVSVVKNRLEYEWPSLMVFNNHLCRALSPEMVASGNPFDFAWADSVGELPAEWNFLVGYDVPLESPPKLIHYTQGLPCFPETQDCDYAKAWHKELNWMNSTVSWEAMMGKSVHAKPVRERLKGASHG